MKQYCQLNIRCSPEEAAFWKKSSQEVSMSLALWVRLTLGNPEGLLAPKGPKPPQSTDVVRQKRKAAELQKLSRQISTPVSDPDPNEGLP